MALLLLAASPRHADATPLTLQLGQRQTSRLAERALVVARTARVLRLAQRAFARSRFEHCREMLERAEQELQHVLVGPPSTLAADLDQLKQVNIWLGVCQAAQRATTAQARQAFVRAARLPGAEPDPTVVPPQLTRRYATALREARQAARCRPRFVLPGGGRPTWIDGQALSTGVTAGEHYLQWRGRDETASARVRVNDRCELAPLSVAAAPGVLSVAEVTDPAFLAALGQAAQASSLIVTRQGGTGTERLVFDVGQGRVVSPWTAVGQARRVTTLPPTRKTGPVVARRPWYRRWWVWTLLGVAATTAVVVPIVVTRLPGERRVYDLSF